MAAADTPFGAALVQRLVARLREAGLGQIAKAEQRSRGVAGADQRAVAVERSDRRIDAFDQPLQPLGQRHEAAGGICRRHQDAVTTVGEIEPRAAAGGERTKPGAKTAQPFQPDRAAQWQPVGELGDLAAVLVGRSENFRGKRCAIGCAEKLRAGRIGPENFCTVGRPQPRRQRACRMSGQSRITDRSQLEFRMIHRDDLTATLVCSSGLMGGHTMTALAER